MQLNSQQRKAVTMTDKPLLVLAGAGSGKTGVITQKIVWLINQKAMQPSNIFAVTFTNKAASEMRQRLSAQLDKASLKKLNISTFHRLGLQFLHSEGKALGLRKGFTILDQGESYSALREIIGEAKLTVDEKTLSARISNWKNEFITPAAALSAAETGLDQASALAYAQYCSLLRACNSVDFDDLICLPVEILRENQDIRDRWQGRVRHLLVDEYQDTNTAQYALVQLLVGKFGLLTAVGDDDQSIYSWRGANPENLNQLKVDYPALEVIKLEQNYRSSQRILRCANAVIAVNPHVFEKKLWSDLGLGDPLRVSACLNAIDEAEWVAAEIFSLKFRKNIRFGDVAILYRSNFQSRLFEQALREKQIPYHISGGKSFFDRAEIKDVMAYLKLMVNPLDDTAFLRIVNTPRRDIGPNTLEKLGNYARERRCSLFHACHELGLESVLSARAFNNLQQFANWMTLSADNVARGSAVDVIRQMLERMNFDDWLQQQAASKAAAQRSIDNVEELLVWIKRQLDDDSGTQRDLSDIISQVTLMDILSRETEESPDQVNMMTLHAAKGLEFPHVYLVGAEEDILPHRNSIESGDIEEERRLAYVGMTRARYNLTLTWVRNRQKFGETFKAEPSRFLDELPEDDVRHIGATPTEESIEQNQIEGRETLNSLREMLSND